MQVYPNQFSQHLQKSLPPVIMVFGDEPQQKLEAIEAVRKAAFADEFTERQNLTADAQFDWFQLIEASQSMSLFSDKQFLELELPTGKPGKEGSKTLIEFAQNVNPDVLLLIHGPKVAKDVQNSKWFKTLDKVGCFVPCFPLEGQQLQRWLQTEMQRIGLSGTPDVLHLLMDYFEGNMLAAKQELEKLKLLYPDGQLSSSQLEKVLVEQSRFNVFQLVDAMLLGDAQKTVKLLNRLEDEGIEPTIVAWALSKEWLLLNELQKANNTSGDMNKVFTANRVWRNKQSLYLGTLNRLSQDILDSIGDKLQQFDSAIKLTPPIRPYVELCHLCLLFMPMALQNYDLTYDFAS